MRFADTIFALSSGRLPAGVAMVRLSGNGVRAALERLAGGVPAARRAAYRSIRAADGTAIDRGIVLYFAAPQSFTGEDCAELHLHGGRAVVAAVLAALGHLEGFRQAEAGEFTRRAFLNGRMDLTGAEALADLIAAETEAQRRFALANAEGRQGALYEAWRGRIVDARAMVEAELDFADEGDVPGSVAERVWGDMAALAGEIGRHLSGFHRAEVARDGYRVVIVGAPNAGKSSLLNALVAREAAIVSDEAGTTRDPIEVALDLEGVKVLVSDTAGLREGAGAVERMGIERAVARAEAADLVLEAVDLSDPRAIPTIAGAAPRLRIGTKADLMAGAPLRATLDHAVSVRSGAGMEALLAHIGRLAADAAARQGEVLPSRLRHVELLRECRARLAAATEAEGGLELRAEELRLAGAAIGRITGSVGVEEVLGAIFSRFCIGK